ncbi:MAG TPA: hypothetical protein VGQ11_05750, partial [Candidatus Acidoferrales bacterium]|nr:hypothetical protein [Candidatus Acidoferrales bacterium]
ALQFGKETYSQPWSVRAFHHVTYTGGQGIALAISHHTWWPAIVVLLNEQGTVLRRFVNSGWITTLYAFDGPNGRLLAAGGANNARNGAALAILDLEHFAGSSPEAKNSPYECLNCEPGRPLKYFIFPRSELNIATVSTFNYSAPYFQGGRLIVKTSEEEAPPGEPNAFAIYEFSPELKLLRASFGDRYWDLHRKLETEGKILHSQAECPDRSGPRTVLSWDPQEGWKELHPN